MFKRFHKLNQPKPRNTEVAYRLGLISGVLIFAIALVLFALLHS